VTLTQHKLSAVAFEEDKSLFLAFEQNLETTPIAPECEALSQVIDMEFRYQPGESPYR
jgi:hypothetical protein